MMLISKFRKKQASGGCASYGENRLILKNAENWIDDFRMRVNMCNEDPLTPKIVTSALRR